MDPSGSSPSPPPDERDTSPHHRRDDPPRTPDTQLLAVTAKRRIMKAGALGSPVRRSPRLSCLPPPPLPSAPDVDESSDDSLNDVAFHLSREETPENDVLPPDEPSSVLARRIMRAHDNPSPPPQYLAHPGINYVPGRDGQFPLVGVSVPPSPFRPINLLERLNPSFDSPHSTRTPSWGIRQEPSQSNPLPSRGFISSEFSSPSTTSVDVKDAANDGLVPVDSVSPSSIQYKDGDLHPRSSQHLITVTRSLESEDLISPPKQAVFLLNPTVPSTPECRLRRLSLCSERQQNVSILPANVVTSALLSPNEHNLAIPGTQTTIPGSKDDGRESLSVAKNTPPLLERGQEGKCERSSIKKVDADSLQRPDSPRFADALEGLRLGPEPTSPIYQTLLPAEPIPVVHQPATPSQLPIPSATHTSVQRPVITPTPVRANGAWKLSSPSKSSFEIDIYRTPAQRVPIETALSREISSLQKMAQLSTDRSRPGHLLAIRAPVFTRPALDDASRSPAKRIPITHLAVSPTRAHEAQTSPTRSGLRTRSASAEPRPFGTALARSRSVEPRAKESSFPLVPTLLRPVTKLPFPLVPGQKSNDIPATIPEEHENVEISKSEIDATPAVTLCNTTSQLRQPPSNSRIPRIGNKPYARPTEAGKTPLSTTTANNARAPKTQPLQLAHKDSGVGNSDAGVSPKHANDRRLLVSLKRKRGVEATAPSNSHPVMVRQVVPGILNEKYTPKPAKLPSQVQVPLDLGALKVPQPLKFRKVIDGMLSARYASAKANLSETVPKDSAPLPPSPLSELSSLSDEGTSDEKLPPTAPPPACPNSKISDIPRTYCDPSVVESTHEHLLRPDADDDEPSSRPRRTSRVRKPAQQQYVLDVFSSNASARLPPARRKPQSRTEKDCFMGMSATALKALTTSNTTKNQQTVAVLATEVIRKEGLRPESPTVKARTILQKQRDERDTRRRERAERRAQMSGERSGDGEVEKQSDLEDSRSLGAHADHDENGFAAPQKHRRGPGDEEDYEAPERPGRINPLRLEGVSMKVKPGKQVKWHRGLSTTVYLDEVDPKPTSWPKNVAVRGCLAPTSKNLPLDPLGNLVDLDNRPSPGLVTEHIVVTRYLYDNDIEPEPIPTKMTRSKNKKSKG